MNHFCHLEDRFVHGQGKRWRTSCRPCGWTSQWHRRSQDVNDDYAKHSTPEYRFVEPPEAELIGYGLHPGLVAKTALTRTEDA